MQARIPIFQSMASQTNGDLPRMTEGPHHSQEPSFDEESVPNESLEQSLTFLNTPFGTNAFLQDIPDINCQWQTMGVHSVNPSCSVYPSPNVVESYNDLWPFDAANTNLSNPYFPETAAMNTPFDNCANFEDSLSHFESDGWLTSFLQSPEPITYSSLQVGAFTEQQSPCEPDHPSVEALPKAESPSTYIPEMDSYSNHFKEDVPTLAPSKLQTDLSSPPDQLTPRASEPVAVTPRNMEDCLIDFHSGVKAPKRKRKEFNRREKLKVHLVRQVGACQSCRARKVECTSDGVCDRCFKLAGDPFMAKQICIRHKLKDVYLGVTDVQTRLLTSGKEQVHQLLRALEGHVAKVELRADCSMASFPCRSLPCKVMVCRSVDLCRWRSLTKMNGVYITHKSLRDKTYLVVPDSLPTVDELDFFGREILLSSPESHSGKITHILDKFLYIYCKQYFGSHLACLCNAAFRITSLNSLAFYGVANIHCHPHGQLDVVNTINDTFSPDTVREQVRLKASEGLEESEKYFFSEIENLSKKSASNKQTRIIAGICLLRLMLFYRERVVRIELRSNLPRCKTDEDLKNCIHPGKTDPQKRLEQCGFMYKQLAVAFSTLCRGDNTPLTIDWEAEAAGRVAPDVPMLSATFLELKSAYAEFCKNNLTHRDDDVFKTLVVEPAEKERDRVAKKQSKLKTHKQPKR
ncbi:87d2cc91-de03-4112-b5b2-7ffb966f8815 [Sclerotinia trifoliorum]|uniref:87d2cc91-de03-4112-b5b2-7ffb966f8815 n=1 Tax=Sclerotinia trifoliorum TaxID=28548 RepID=A0A8H2VLW9_9HELO|nr:87d2cc91-de03-4112-b5b2-7ffb966f8815 [Sclerotinia trifoliorum]